MKKNCSLPDGELKIMQIIWQCVVPVSRSDIEAKLDKHLAPTTILTLLARLCGKGFLRTERRGNTNLYIPLVQHKDYLAKESRRILDLLYGGSLSNFAVSLCKSGVTKEEIAELRKILEEDAL